MLENKFGELFEESRVAPEPHPTSAPAAPPQIGPFISANQIYQAAYDRSLRDH